MDMIHAGHFILRWWFVLCSVSSSYPSMNIVGVSHFSTHSVGCVKISWAMVFFEHLNYIWHLVGKCETNTFWSLNVDNMIYIVLYLNWWELLYTYWICSLTKNRGQPLYQMSWKRMTIWPSSLQSTLKEHPSIKRRHLDFCLTATCGMCSKHIYSDWRRRTSTQRQPLQRVTRHPW